jgi:hypothetical protein
MGAKDGPSIAFSGGGVARIRLFDLEHDHSLIVKDL